MTPTAKEPKSTMFHKNIKLVFAAALLALAGYQFFEGQILSTIGDCQRYIATYTMRQETALTAVTSVFGGTTVFTAVTPRCSYVEEQG